MEPVFVPSVDPSVLDMPHKWNATMYHLLSGCLVGSSTLQYTSVIYFYGQIILHCMCTPHTICLSIHPSNGHLDCFYLLAMVNTSMNIYMYLDLFVFCSILVTIYCPPDFQQRSQSSSVKER
jgi:hypothetical protein